MTIEIIKNEINSKNDKKNVDRDQFPIPVFSFLSYFFLSFLKELNKL